MKNTPQQEEEERKHKVGGWEEEQLHLHTYTMDIMDMNSINGFYLLWELSQEHSPGQLQIETR